MACFLLSTAAAASPSFRHYQRWGCRAPTLDLDPVAAALDCLLLFCADHRSAKPHLPHCATLKHRLQLRDAAVVNTCAVTRDKIRTTK